MIPTVRVANPATDGFKTINAEDYNAEVHGDLWHTQATGFKGLPEAPAIEVRMDPAVRDKAVALFVQVLDLQAKSDGKPAFSTLSPDQQLVTLRDAENDIAVQVTRKAEYEKRWSEEATVHKAAIAAKDAETAEAARLAREAADSAEKAADTLTGQDKPPAPPAPAQAPGANPFAANPAPASEPLTVSQGPGRKWFVMRGTTPVTEGLGTKGEAEAAKTKLEAA